MVSVFVLPEDRNRNAVDVIKALCKRLFQLVEPTLQTHRLAFDRLPGAVTGNRWKSTNHRDRQIQVDLVRSIATKLREAAGFVVFHFDGDEPWKDRDKGVTWRQFEERILSKVQMVLEDAPPPRPAAPPATDVDTSLRKLLVLSPYYSIEAWLYQNTEVARELCVRHHGGRHLDRFAEWEGDRGAIDEIRQPKESCCLGASFNLDLTTSFPTSAAWSAGKSFAAAAISLALCPELVDELRALGNRAE